MLLSEAVRLHPILFKRGYCPPPGCGGQKGQQQSLLTTRASTAVATAGDVAAYFARIAQLAERRFCKAMVAGSSPAFGRVGGGKYKRTILSCDETANFTVGNRNRASHLQVSLAAGQDWGGNTLVGNGAHTPGFCTIGARQIAATFVLGRHIAWFKQRCFVAQSVVV